MIPVATGHTSVELLPTFAGHSPPVLVASRQKVASHLTKVTYAVTITMITFLLTDLTLFYLDMNPRCKRVNILIQNTGLNN
jgi:hypothetical protein